MQITQFKLPLLIFLLLFLLDSCSKDDDPSAEKYSHLKSECQLSDNYDSINHYLIGEWIWAESCTRIRGTDPFYTTPSTENKIRKDIYSDTFLSVFIDDKLVGQSGYRLLGFNENFNLVPMDSLTTKEVEFIEYFGGPYVTTGMVPIKICENYLELVYGYTGLDGRCSDVFIRE